MTAGLDEVKVKVYINNQQKINEEMKDKYKPRDPSDIF